MNIQRLNAFDFDDDVDRDEQVDLISGELLGKDPVREAVVVGRHLNFLKRLLVGSLVKQATHTFSNNIYQTL